jgi:hypothetical protein
MSPVYALVLCGEHAAVWTSTARLAGRSGCGMMLRQHGAGGAAGEVSRRLMAVFAAGVKGLQSAHGRR